MKLLSVVFAVVFISILTGCNDATPITNTDNNDQPVLRDVILYWSAPLTRVDGSALAQSDIGGYEVRYKRSSESSYKTIVIPGSSVMQYSFDSLENIDTYTFEVAVFDTDGIYSEFVTAASN